MRRFWYAVAGTALLACGSAETADKPDWVSGPVSPGEDRSDWKLRDMKLYDFVDPIERDDAGPDAVATLRGRIIGNDRCYAAPAPTEIVSQDGGTVTIRALLWDVTEETIEQADRIARLKKEGRLVQDWEQEQKKAPIARSQGPPMCAVGQVYFIAYLPLGGDDLETVRVKAVNVENGDESELVWTLDEASVIRPYKPRK